MLEFAFSAIESARMILSSLDPVAASVSAVIAFLAFLLTLIQWLGQKKQWRDQKKPPALEVEVKVTPLIDGDSINAKFFGEPIRPTYTGTFLVKQGRVTLSSCGFYIKRRSETGEVVVHVCPGKFEPEREMPTLDIGEGIIAIPADNRRVRSLLTSAISVRVEFQTLSGQIYRSEDLEIHADASISAATA